MRLEPGPDFADFQGFCRHWNIRELSLIRTGTHRQDGRSHDLALLVGFEEGCEPDLFAFSRLAGAMGAMLGRQVQLLSRSAVASNRNPFHRQAILAGAEPLYVT